MHLSPRIVLISAKGKSSDELVDAEEIICQIMATIIYGNRNIHLISCIGWLACLFFPRWLSGRSDEYLKHTTLCHTTPHTFFDSTIQVTTSELLHHDDGVDLLMMLHCKHEQHYSDEDSFDCINTLPQSS